MVLLRQIIIHTNNIATLQLPAKFHTLKLIVRSDTFIRQVYSLTIEKSIQCIVKYIYTTYVDIYTIKLPSLLDTLYAGLLKEETKFTSS